ncbi:MAG TPA: HNH endonuclease signature motif containing protein, partial [Candidatus Dormibacteraeota bacterium]
VDVGRATRTIQPATRRALQKRDRGCRFPGCERPVSWSTPHHIEFWSHGGKTNLSNLVLLCHFHHRLVHEEGWQVLKVGDDFRFIPPVHLRTRFARGPDLRWAA